MGAAAMSSQPALLDWSPPRTAYPLAPGAKREGTSQDAADAIAPRAPFLREKVLAELRRGPGTADGIAARLALISPIGVLLHAQAVSGGAHFGLDAL